MCFYLTYISCGLTSRAYCCSLAQSSSLRRQKRSLKCPIHWISTPVEWKGDAFISHTQCTTTCISLIRQGFDKTDNFRYLTAHVLTTRTIISRHTALKIFCPCHVDINFNIFRKKLSEFNTYTHIIVVNWWIWASLTVFTWVVYLTLTWIVSDDVTQPL